MSVARRGRQRERKPLAGSRLLVEFAFVLGAGLAAVFPTRREYAEFANDQTPNAYSIAYLRVLTRSDPHDMHLQLIYARHLIALGEWSDALAALEPVINDPVLGSVATDLRFDVLLARARAIPDGDPSKKIAFAAIKVELSRMAELPERRDRLPAYARLALELEDSRLAARFYLRAADADSAHAVDFLEEAGKWLRSSGDSVGSAKAYDRAASSANEPGRATRNRTAALEALEADNRVGEACDLAQVYLGRYPNDVDLLAKTVALATGANRTQLARDLGRRLLATDPDDEGMIEQQATRELWAGDPAAALPLIKRLREMRPNDARVRELEAHVAEWSGQPELALDDWLWLLSNGHSR